MSISFYKLCQDFGAATGIVTECHVGNLTEGQPISEKLFTEELGISRTPLREALNVLEQEHLLEIRAKRGVFVTRIDYRDINNIYSLRLVLETLAVQKAAPNLNRTDLLKQLRISDEVSDYDTPSTHIDRDNELHGMIADATGNKYLLQFLYRLQDQARRIRFLSVRRDGRRQSAISHEHKAIIKGLLAGDLNAAENAMRTHLEHARDTALKVFGA